MFVATHRLIAGPFTLQWDKKKKKIQLPSSEGVNNVFE
jgi:hypothetical protein